MKHILLPSATIPALGLGTYRLMNQAAIAVVDYALGIGYRHLDTAQMYQNEAAIGKALAQTSVPREDIFLTTKVWPDRFARGAFVPSVEESLNKLQTSYVDLLLLHWPNPSVPLEETVTELVKIQERGLARHIGVSNFNTDLIQQTLDLGAPIINNQVEYHVFLSQEKVLETIREKEMMLTAYCPIAKAKVVGHPAIQAIAAKHGKTEPQIALRWLMQQPNVAAIPSSTKKERVKAHIEIFDMELSRADMQVLSALHHPKGRMVDPDFGQVWD